MKKVVFIILLLYGAYYFGSRYLKFDDSLKFVRNHKSASWASRANYSIGVIYYLQDNHPKAQEAFTQMLEDHPKSSKIPRVLVYLSDSAGYNGDWEAVKSALSRYIEEYPEGKDIQVVRKRLELVRYQHGS